MFTLLAKLFVKDYKNYANPATRRSYGTLCSIFAIFLNLLMVGAKLAVASISGSFSIRADALNNLTDVGSSLLLLLAFYFAGMKPRPDRPFGHGRIEYVAGLFISCLIIVFGVELARTSLEHITNPTSLTFSWLTIWILLGSIGTKFYMSFFMISTSKKIHSEALHATGLDSLSDTLSTFAVTASLLIYHLTPNHLNLDGWFGMLVSLLILKTGIESAKDTLFQLLGTKPSPELVQQIKDICMDHEDVIGIHDLVVHDYGPGRLHVSVHCEVPGNHDIFELHEAMDHIMRELDTKIGCESVIHMDPICTDDGKVAVMRQKLEEALSELGPHIHVHDFRMVHGIKQTNLLFDCLIPYEDEPDAEKAEKRICEIVSRKFENCVAIVKIDRPYA